MPLAIEPIATPPKNGTITTQINGVDVAIKVGYYPSPAKPTSCQWRVHVPIFEPDKDKVLQLDHWQNDLLSGFNLANPDKQASLVTATEKVRNAAIIAKVVEQWQHAQAEWDKRYTTEREELVMELAEVPVKQARKVELDTIIAAKEVR